MAETALDCQQYHPINTSSITWADCSLRQWLTGSDAQGTGSIFYNNAFTAAEKAKIALTKHETCNWGGTGEHGEATEDLVFLLDEREANALYSSGAERQCSCTEYAITQGAEVDSGHCYWWLRSPGGNAISAAGVDSDGYIDYGDVRHDNIAVRPAFYIAL